MKAVLEVARRAFHEKVTPDFVSNCYDHVKGAIHKIRSIDFEDFLTLSLFIDMFTT